MVICRELFAFPHKANIAISSQLLTTKKNSEMDCFLNFKLNAVVDVVVVVITVVVTTDFLSMVFVILLLLQQKITMTWK